MANTNNPGNFSNDRQKAQEAGRKGGQASGSSNTGSKAGSSNDKQKATDTGKKGGNHSGGGGRS